jgi:nucleoside-diphosphate-sugar epimerase
VDALLIGGTGPTGHFMVNGLLARGHRVAMLHTGRHELDEIPDSVEHIHTDPYDEQALRGALGERRFDLCIATYGRLRTIAQVLQGRVGRLISIGGVPAYRGFMNPELLDPAGLPVPTAEDAPLVAGPEDDEKGWRIRRTEEAVFRLHPDATHFRYPYVYGPYQLLPREWCIVRRILDGRRRIIVPDGGLSLHHFGYAGNLAHAVLLAVDRPDVSAGQIYNCGDREILTLRQVIEIVARALDAELEIVSMPWRFAVSSRPLIAQPLPTHRVLDLGKLERDLGYRDALAPRDALALTARWLRDHPPEPGGVEETVLQDPFDYAAEDRLIEAWQKLCAEMPDPGFEREPGFTLSYSGPGGRARSGDFKD